MSKRMLIDATHEEETRVAIVDGNKLAEYDYESSSRKPIKGNIYLAKVTRVEPSLQAAFVNFGGNRHGFLPFSEIHPDYFRIPIADREALIAEQEALLAAQEAELEAEAQADIEAAAQAMGEDSGEILGDDPVEDDYIEEIGGVLPSLEEDGAKAETEQTQDPALFVPHAPQESFVDGEEEGEDSDELASSEADGEEDAFNGEGAQSLESAEDNPQGEQGRDSRGRRGRGRGRDRGRGGRAPFRSRRSEIVGEEDMDPQERFRFNLRRKYKIQEVIKRGQIMLVQANKEERGNKGAAVGTYLSLPGRYCVLMPNSPRAGGVSRKIANYKDRARMREIMRELEVPRGMSVIVRTAGVARTKAEIKRDLDYLMRLWDNIRELTLQSTAPSLVYEEADLIKRAIRDLYTREVEDIVVAGENGFKIARNFMKMMVPSHIKKVQMYEEAQIPLFTRYQIETQIQEIGVPTVRLRSGGYLVINPTEALVSIDVNSGKATKERHIEETALKTNLEAADEVARQLRLRDLGGLVVIDFIDMEDRRNNAKVERRLKEALSTDRARVQVGRISSFGLLELSRQRLSPSLTESQYEKCGHCQGLGVIRTPEAMSIVVLRAIEEEGIKARAAQITVHVSNAVALYILNNKRRSVIEIEQRYGFEVVLLVDEDIPGSEYRIELSKALNTGEGAAEDEAHEGVVAPAESDSEPERQGRDRDRGSRVRRGGRGGRGRFDREDRGDRPQGRREDQRRNTSEDSFAEDVNGNQLIEEEFDEEADNIGNRADPSEGEAFRPRREREGGRGEGRDRGDDNNRRGGRNRRRGGRGRNRGDRGPRSDQEGGNGSNQSAFTPQNEAAEFAAAPSRRPEASNDDRERTTPPPRQEERAPEPVIRQPQPKKEPQASASYEVVSESASKEKKRGWWNRLVE